MNALTPNFKRYEARIDGGEWKASSEDFVWSMQQSGDESPHSMPFWWRGQPCSGASVTIPSLPIHRVRPSLLFMNTKRLILAIVVVFITVFVTNVLIHGVWLNSVYKETASLWRTEPEMNKHFPWMLLGQFLFSATFVVIWSKGFPAVASLSGSCAYGLTMALFGQSLTIITYVVQPMPGSLMAKWFFAGIVQGLLMGVVVFLVGKPKAAPAGSTV
jgi:hypothetical protein